MGGLCVKGALKEELRGDFGLGFWGREGLFGFCSWARVLRNSMAAFSSFAFGVLGVLLVVGAVMRGVESIPSLKPPRIVLTSLISSQFPQSHRNPYLLSNSSPANP